MHLSVTLKEVGGFDPQAVVVDPLSSFMKVGNENDVQRMLLRLVDALKVKGITSFFTSLTPSGGAQEQTEVAISSSTPVARHGALQSDPRVLAVRPGHRVARRLHRPGRRADRASQRAAMEAQVVAIRAEFAALEAAALAVIGQAEISEARLSLNRDEMAHRRSVEPT